MAYRDSTLTTANALTLNATTPAAKAGDDMFTYFVTDGGLNSGITLTPPSGWTLITGSNQGANTGAPDGWTSWVYWRVASGNEPATYAWTIAGIPATDLTAIVVALSGRNNLSPTFITHGTVNTTGNATPVTVSDTGVTANTNDDILVFATGDITVGTDTWAFTPPTNYTERQDSKFNFNVATLATRDEVFAGATGTLSLTLTRSAGTGTAGWGIFVIAVPAQPQAQIKTPAFIFPRKFYPFKLSAPQPIPGEDITIDKWNEQYENPLRKSLPTAAISASLFFVPVITQAETITLDKWYQPPSQPLQKQSYRQGGGEFRFEVPRTILITDWYQSQTNPVLRPQRQILGGESRTDIVIITDWMQPAGQPLSRAYRLIQGGETRVDVVTSSEIITIDKWFQPISQPYFNTKINANFGEYRFEVPRDILVSDWFSEVSQPVRERARQLLGGESRVDIVIIPEGEITLDKWYQPTQQPYFSKIVLIGTWEFRVDIVTDAPIVPISPPSTPIDGFHGGGGSHHPSEEDKERQRIDDLLKDDEIILMALKIWVNNFR